MARRQTGRRQQKKQTGPHRRSLFMEYGESVFVAAILFFFLRFFVVQAFQIPSGSMEDTLLVGDFLVANKFVYGARIPGTEMRLPKIRDPKRGDIIVFRAPHQDNDFIKRCVAVEGDTVLVRDNHVLINGKMTDEEFVAIKGPNSRISNWGPKVVPEGHLFMLGDNRNQSSDSRVWGFLDKKRVKGHAMFLYFSLNKDTFIPRFNRFFRVIR